MRIEKNKLVNQDIRLGIIAYSVAQSLEKEKLGKITEDAAVFEDCKESAKELCDEDGLYVYYSLVPHLNSISMWRARLTKAVFLLFAGYLGFHCYMASLWLPLVLCVLLMMFIISLKNKDLA